MNFKKKILIDLDGVLNKYDGHLDESCIPEPEEGAKEFLQKLNKCADLYLFTTRKLKAAVKWLLKNNLDIYFKDVTNIKIPAYLYIDDRTICFKGDFEVYWKIK